MSKRSIFRNLGTICVLGLVACGPTNEVQPDEDPGKIINIPDDKPDDKIDDKIDNPDDVEKFLTTKNSITKWIISPEAAKSYLKGSDGMILDTRPKTDFDADNIPGSKNVDWKTFSMTEEAERGELLPLNEIGALLEGLTEKTWVFVIGDTTDGWGEDGRIVWMLQALGHKNVAMIDGGFAAAKTLAEPKEEPSSNPTSKPAEIPEYVPSVSEFAFFANADDVKAAITSDVQLIDVREKREFDGETPYGETRGGHVPTAIHLHYKTLLDSEGKVLPIAELKEALISAGIDLEKPSIAYCTGGVRSAWLTAIMIALELDAKNYAGSMWQWASYDAADYPLEK